MGLFSANQWWLLQSPEGVACLPEPSARCCMWMLRPSPPPPPLSLSTTGHIQPTLLPATPPTQNVEIMVTHGGILMYSSNTFRCFHVPAAAHSPNVYPWIFRLPRSGTSAALLWYTRHNAMDVVPTCIFLEGYCRDTADEQSELCESYRLGF